MQFEYEIRAEEYAAAQVLYYKELSNGRVVKAQLHAAYARNNNPCSCADCVKTISTNDVTPFPPLDS